MARVLALSLAVLATASILSCAPRERITMDEGRLEHPPISAMPYEGPLPRVSVRRSPLGRTVDVRLTVPTGGHRLMMSEADVISGEAMLFITLMRPARDEAVTMAYETLRVTHETDRRFDYVRVYIREHRRAETPPRDYQYAGQFAAD